MRREAYIGIMVTNGEEVVAMLDFYPEYERFVASVTNLPVPAFEVYLAIKGWTIMTNMQKYRVVGVSIDFEGAERHLPLFHTFGMKNAAHYVMANAEDFEERFSRVYIEEE